MSHSYRVNNMLASNCTALYAGSFPSSQEKQMHNWG